MLRPKFARARCSYVQSDVSDARNTQSVDPASEYSCRRCSARAAATLVDEATPWTHSNRSGAAHCFDYFCPAAGTFGAQGLRSRFSSSAWDRQQHPGRVCAGTRLIESQAPKIFRRVA